MEQTALVQSQERLVEAAGQVFADKGFRAATVRDICRAAEANVAAVNYYFRGKRQLYVEAVKRAYRSRMKQVPLPEWPTNTPAARKLRDFIHTVLKRMLGADDPGWHTRLVVRELFEPTPACAQWVREFIRPQFELLLRILQELLPAKMPEHQRHLIVFSIIGQCLYYRVAGHIAKLLVGDTEFRAFDLGRLADHIAEFSLAAIGVNSRSKKNSRH